VGGTFVQGSSGVGSEKVKKNKSKKAVGEKRGNQTDLNSENEHFKTSERGLRSGR